MPRRAGSNTGDLRSLALASARALLESEGAADLGLRAIAREAGVTAMALAHHFGDKNGLLEAIAREGWLELAEALARTGDGGLAAAMRILLEFAEARPRLLQLMLRPDLLDHLAAARDRCLGEWGRACGAAANGADPVAAISWGWALGLAEILVARAAPEDVLQHGVLSDVTGAIATGALGRGPSRSR